MELESGTPVTAGLASGPAGHCSSVLLPTHVDQQRGTRHAAVVHCVLWGRGHATATQGILGAQKYMERVWCERKPIVELTKPD